MSQPTVQFVMPSEDSSLCLRCELAPDIQGTPNRKSDPH